MHKNLKNLLIDLRLREPLEKDEYYEEDFVLCLQGAIQKVHLDEREEKIINHYCFEFKTYDQIAKIYGVTRERIRQILRKGIRKVRHPSRMNIVLCELYDEYEKLFQQKKRIEREHEKICDCMNRFLHNHRLNIDICKEVPVSELEFSIRTSNCLKDADIDTLGDLLLCTEQDLLSFRNLGKKSLQEIKDILHELNYKLSGEK